MLKIVILSSDFDFIKLLCNSIINEVRDLQMSGFATNQNDFSKLVDKINPEIIVMKQIDFINSKYSKKSDSNMLKILFGSSEKTIKCSSNILFISESASCSEIVQAIQKFISNQSSTFLRNKIIKILEDFCFNFKLMGTTYLLESILYCYENKTDYVFENLEKNVYPEIGKIFSTNVSSVKQAIVRSINSMNATISPIAQKQLSKNFKVDISEKTTAKHLISTIVTKL